MSFSVEIVLATCVFICLSLGIILFVVLYQRRVINHQIQMREFNRQKETELMQASIRSEEGERMRIAAELHDDVGATLSSIRLFLTQAARHPEDVSLIHQSKELLDESIRKVRSISHQLQPGTLAYLGLAKALQSLAETITRSGSMHMEAAQEGEWPEPDEQTALSLYRIVQELVTNITKHAAATWIRVVLHAPGGRHSITIAHNGAGLSEEDYRKHLYKPGAIGLKNIETRLKSAGIGIQFGATAEGSPTITLNLPAQ